MVTPLGVLVAVIIVCVMSSALMILVMIFGSATAVWHRRLNVGTIAIGLALVAFGLFQFRIARESEETGQPSRYKGSPVTAAQSRAAGIGLVALGAAAVVIALVHRESDVDDASTPPTI